MKRVSSPKRKDKAKPTAADRRLAREVIKLVSSWCGFYAADVEELEKLLCAARAKWRKR